MSHSRFRSRAWCLAALALLLPAAVRAAEWLELRAPHFTVLSEASEQSTRAWAAQFEIFRRALNQLIPTDPRYLDQATVVIFRSDRRLRPFKPLEKGKPALVGGFIARHGGRCTIALSIEGARDDVRELVFHEAVHWHTTAAARKLPLWFEEGLGEVFGNFVLSGDSFTVGAFRQEALRYVQVAGPMPFSELKTYGASGLEYNGRQNERTGLFYRQSWLVVHQMMFGRGGEGIPRVAAYITGVPSSDDPVEDFAQAFAVSDAAMDERLKQYVLHKKFESVTQTFDRSSVDAGFALAPATEAAVDLAMGQTLLGAGRGEDAELYLLRASSALPDDPRPYEALALAAYSAGRRDDATGYFREAVARGSVNHWAYLGLAEAEAAHASAIYGPPDVVPAARHLARCLELKPHCVEAAELLGQLAEFLPAGSDFEPLLTRLAGQYASNATIQLGMIFLEAKAGHVAAAQRRLEQLRLPSAPGQRLQAKVERAKLALRSREGAAGE